MEPVTSLRDIMNEPDGDFMNSRAVKVWVASFIVDFICHYPIYVLYNLNYDDPVFIAATFFGATMTLVGSGITTHLMLKMVGISSDASSTLKLYAVMVAAYAPLETLLSFPVAARSLSLLHTLRLHRVEMAAAARSFISFAQHSADQQGAFSAAASFIAGLISFIYLMLFSEAVAYKNKVNRTAVYKATALGMLLGALPGILIGVFILFTEYGAIRPS